jgi:hypothetical protein
MIDSALSTGAAAERALCEPSKQVRVYRMLKAEIFPSVLTENLNPE